MRMRVSRSRGGSSCALVDIARVGAGLLDDLVGEVLAAAAFELAAHRGISRFGIGAAARGRGADIAVPNHIARANDHEHSMPIMRTIRKSLSEQSPTARSTSAWERSLRGRREGR